MKKFLTFSFFVLCIWHILPRFEWREAECHETWRRTQRRRCVRHCCWWWWQYCWASVGPHPLLACLPPHRKSSSPFFLSFFLSLWNWLKLRNLITRLDVTDVTDKTWFDEVSPTQIVNCGLLCNLYIYREREREYREEELCFSLFLTKKLWREFKKEFHCKSPKELKLWILFFPLNIYGLKIPNYGLTMESILFHACFPIQEEL